MIDLQKGDRRFCIAALIAIRLLQGSCVCTVAIVWGAALSGPRGFHTGLLMMAAVVTTCMAVLCVYALQKSVDALAGSPSPPKPRKEAS